MVPTNTVAGSGDVTVTITGTGFSGSGPHNRSFVVLSANGTDTMLVTTFISTTELTAVIPAALLVSPVTAQVFVETGDFMSDGPLPTTNKLSFSVVSAAGQPVISAISPASAVAGSADLTLTITGSNFHNAFSDTATAFWNGTSLKTTFVSSTEVTAVVPANLLQNPGTASVFVMNMDQMGFAEGATNYPTSNAFTFTVQ
jgi:hypothetical protein